MEKIPYSELQNLKKQIIKEKVGDEDFTLNHVGEFKVLNDKISELAKAYFEKGVIIGINTILNTLTLHGYIETNFME